MKDPRISRRKEILKIRAEINAKERKWTIALKEGRNKSPLCKMQAACSKFLPKTTKTTG